MSGTILIKRFQSGAYLEGYYVLLRADMVYIPQVQK